MKFQVVSLDEDNGRVMVDITVIKETVSLSEFMMHPVTKSEFDKESKVLSKFFSSNFTLRVRTYLKIAPIEACYVVV